LGSSQPNAPPTNRSKRPAPRLFFRVTGACSQTGSKTVRKLFLEAKNFKRLKERTEEELKEKEQMG